MSIYKTKKSRSSEGTNQKSPKDANQWADDAFAALEKALIAFEEDYPNPDEEERLELVGYAAELAAKARGISDTDRIDEADEYAVDNVLEDIGSEDEDIEGLQYPILFLLCYLDAHVSYGLLSESQLESVMESLVENYDLKID